MGRGEGIMAICILAASLAGCATGTHQGSLAAEIGPKETPTAAERKDR